MTSTKDTSSKPEQLLPSINGQTIWIQRSMKIHIHSTQIGIWMRMYSMVCTVIGDSALDEEFASGGAWRWEICLSYSHACSTASTSFKTQYVISFARLTIRNILSIPWISPLKRRVCHLTRLSSDLEARRTDNWFCENAKRRMTISWGNRYDPMPIWIAHSYSLHCLLDD